MHTLKFNQRTLIVECCTYYVTAASWLCQVLILDINIQMDFTMIECWWSGKGIMFVFDTFRILTHLLSFCIFTVSVMKLPCPRLDNITLFLALVLFFFPPEKCLADYSKSYARTILDEKFNIYEMFYFPKALLKPKYHTKHILFIKSFSANKNFFFIFLIE